MMIADALNMELGPTGGDGGSSAVIFKFTLPRKRAPEPWALEKLQQIAERHAAPYAKNLQRSLSAGLKKAISKAQPARILNQIPPW